VSAVLSTLWLEDLDGTHWIVCAPFRYESDLLRGVVVVPIGTETDLASIPWVFRGLAPMSGKWNKAAVLHDAGYHGKLETVDCRRIRLIKSLCDQLFLEAMLVSGIAPTLARFMYRAVSQFGKKEQNP
jgi:hypothetical protein